MSSPAHPPHPLVELSNLADPAAARHPLSRAAIITVTRALRRAMVSEKWPKGFQIVGLAFCELARDRVLISDDMGLGKTVTALCRILLGGYLPAIIVCPSSVLLNWEKEARSWLPGVPVLRLDKAAKAVPARRWRGIVLTTWDLLTAHADGLADLGARIVIADEAHYALNEKTLRGQSFHRVIERAPRLLLLTGTPIVNRPLDLWRLLHMVAPRAWPEATQSAFKAVNKDRIDGDLQTRLARRVRQYMLRRVKDQALPDLTAKEHREVYVRLAPAAMQRYRRIEDDFRAWLETRTRKAVDIDLEEAELADVAAAAGVPLDEDGEPPSEDDIVDRIVEARMAAALRAPDLVQRNHLRQLVGVLKAPLAAQWVAEAVRGGEPVVVFAQHQEVIQRIAASLRAHNVKHGVIDGATTKTRRFSLVKEFQGGSLDALLCSPAAKEGITLTRARHVLQAERWWTAAAEDQGADRLHRIGQTRDVCVWVMIARDTIDERMDTVVSRKRRVTMRTVG